ncbi:MAG: aminoglycoside 6-adenylyltransferase [Bifidobacteriaceae bacterium]|nr:aminoglycoside 6-adenylyltransferase [Bifidobacteriaceae bacterium]
MPTNYREIIRQLTPLLRDSEAVLGAAVIGSRASDAPDSAADLDLLVFAAEPEALLADNAWISRLGRIWASTVDRTFPELPVKRLLLDDAAQVDLLILAPEAPDQLGPGARAVLADIARRGFDALKEGGPVPEGLAKLAEESGAGLRARPSQDQFSQLVARFWIDAARAARRLGRGEVWAARRIVDGFMKDALVELQAWVIRALKGPDCDTYWRGRHLEQWVTPRFAEDLAATFGPLEAEAVRRDLTETMDQFRLLAIQAASRWSLDYAENLDRRVTVWVRIWE